MLYADPLLPDDIKLIFCQKIINIRHDPLCGILDRKDCIISLAKSNLLHRCTEGLDMVAVDLLREICSHGRIAVCALNSLKNNVYIFERKFVDHLVVSLCSDTILGQKLVLAFAADRHDLLKKLLRTKAVEASMCLILENIQFVLFSLRVKYLLSCVYLVFCNIFADFHSFFK